MNKYIYTNAQEASRELTVQMVRWMTEEPLQNFNIAVSGGSTPATLFTVWKEDFAGQIDWNRLHIYWVDERCVDPRSPESNYGMTKNILLDYIPIPAENIHRIIGEVEPDFEAKRYGEMVIKSLPQQNGLPLFDLVLLGIGDDGHTASIFPNRFDLLVDPEVYAVGYHPQSGQARVTLTGPTIRNAKRIVFFVTGEGKASVIRSIFTNDEFAPNYPSFKIAEAAPHAVFYLDEGAAKLL